MKTFEGSLIPSQSTVSDQPAIRVGIVAARFNEFITSKLVGGALDGLRRHDVPEEDVDIAWVR